MKIAQYGKPDSSPSSGYGRIILQRYEGDPDPDRSGNYVRLTEWADVEFSERAPEEIVPAQLAALDKAEQDLRAQFQLKLNEIAEARAKVRCLTHEEVAA